MESICTSDPVVVRTKARGRYINRFRWGLDRTDSHVQSFEASGESIGACGDESVVQLPAMATATESAPNQVTKLCVEAAAAIDRGR